MGPDHPDVGNSYNEIGGVHRAKGEYDKALRLNRKALAILLKQFSPDHPDVGNCYWGIGAAWRGKKDMAKAKEFIGKGHAILLKQLGPNHPDTKKAKAELDALR